MTSSDSYFANQNAGGASVSAGIQANAVNAVQNGSHAGPGVNGNPPPYGGT